MKAVIMAGGEGTRLRPLTSRQPKPMLPLANRPMMEHILYLLRDHNIEDIVVTVAFLADNVRNYFGDGSEFGVRIRYATEETPLGTAGSVLNAMEELDETFLVISGDVLTDIDLTALVRAHHDRAATATIALKAMDNPLEFGIVITREDASVERFLEKPGWGQVFSDTVNTGIYVLDPSVFEHIPVAQSSDFSNDVFPRLLRENAGVFGHVVEGYWGDVGTLDGYLDAHYDVLDGKVEIDVPGFRLEKGVWLGEGAEVSPEADLQGPCVVGAGCTIEAGARLGEYTVLGSNTRVGQGADIERTVVHDNCYLGESVRLRGNVLGRNVDIRRSVRCEEGVVIGEGTFIGDHAVISTGVKVYPHKEVEHGAIVNSSIVWESRASRNLFGRLGVAGLANVDITPELAVRVAMAFASVLEKGATISASRDSSRAARALVRAMVAGLNAAGANVLDLEVAPVPVTRFQVRSQRSQAGITVRLAPDDPESVVIRFFDSEGHDIDEATQRKIERVYHREDFRRVAASEIGDIGFPSRAIEYYTEALVATVPLDAIRNVGFKVVLDYAYGSPSFVMPNVLSKLDAEVLTVNPFGSTRSMLRFDRQEHAARVAALVQVSGAHLGAVFDPDGERITLVDDTGHVLTDDEARLAMIVLAGQAGLLGLPSRPDGASGPPRVTLPVSAPLAAQRLANQYGMDVVWTKLVHADVMEKASGPAVALGIGHDGGYIVPNFLPAYDSICAFVNVLGMLARTGTTGTTGAGTSSSGEAPPKSRTHRSKPGGRPVSSVAQPLSAIVSGLPKVHLAHETVATPWEQKGLLMRSLVETVRGKEIVLVDGVKVLDGETWALVLPDPEKPMTHVWAEGPSGRDARTVAQQYVRRIRQSLRSP